jgi:small subunit ribosomal protein S6
MKTYEGLFIINPNLKEDDVKKAFKAITDSITKNNGSVEKEESWGKKQLAYPVRKFREGYYYKLNFSLPPESVEKIEGIYKLNGDILRTLISKR